METTGDAGDSYDFLYPREGTETTSSPRLLMLALPIFFIPARGRKLLHLLLCIIINGFSLSPRGDGNPEIYCIGADVHDFLYPREGTETTASFSRRIIVALIFFIPARGRKQQVVVPAKFYLRFSLSPRGDGSIFSNFPHKIWCPRIFFIPARGRKQIQHIRNLGVDDFLYPREGTETSTFAL